MRKEPLYVAEFRVGPHATRKLAKIPESAQPSLVQRKDVRSWLKVRRIDSPPEATATYLPESRKLVVHDTKHNLDRINTLLDLLDPAETSAR